MNKEIRVVNKEKGVVQITTPDERWYTKQTDDTATGLPVYEFVPSVTWICEYYPKGIGYYKWLADKGWNEAEAIKTAAGDKGSKVHLAVAALIDGATIRMDSTFVNKDTGKEEELTLEEYECVMSFVDWFSKVKPKILRREFVVFNDGFDYAGTVDLECEIDGELFIVDLKTSQYIWPSHELQVSAYKEAIDNLADMPADNVVETAKLHKIAILQLGYQKNKTNKYKFTEIEDKFQQFLAARTIWRNENEGKQPKQKDYPLSICLNPVGTATQK